MPRYIDAEKANKIMLNAMCGTGYQSRAMSAIDDTPTADVEEVKHGYWKLMKHRVDDLVEHWYRKCSCCGTEFHSSLMAGCCADIDGHAYLFPNCPACRAVMDGKESGE